jgi:hypothetical protein
MPLVITVYCCKSTWKFLKILRSRQNHKKKLSFFGRGVCATDENRDENNSLKLKIKKSKAEVDTVKRTWTITVAHLHIQLVKGSLK